MSVYSLASRLNSVQIEVKSKVSNNNPAFTGTVTGITKAMVGLGNVENTSDANKPVSDAVANALASKANINGTALQFIKGKGTFDSNTNLTTTSATQFQSTTANDAATGGGQIYLNGSAGNRIDFASVGFAAPTTGGRSVGTKIVLFPDIDAFSS